MFAFAIYDSKAEAYAQPFFARTRGEAIRSFTDAVNGSVEQFVKYPEDFHLYLIGEYDETRGFFIPAEPIIHLGKGADFKRPE